MGGSHTGPDFLAGLVTHGAPTVEQSAPEGMYLVGRTHVGAACVGLYPMGKTPC